MNGPIDILVLNHVMGMWAHWGSFIGEDTIAFDIERLFSVNTFSYMRLASFALSSLKKTQGTIAVVSSTAGKIGLPKVAAYSASKHALGGFFNSLRHELIRNSTDVSITTIVLGFIDTKAAVEATAGDLEGMKRQSPRHAAEVIVASTQQRRREVYFPWPELGPLLMLHPLCPDFMDYVIRSFMKLSD